MALTGQAIVRIVGDDSHATATMRKFNGEVANAKRTFDKDFGEIAAIAQRSMLVVSVAIGAVVLAIHELGESYDAVIAAQRKLEAASKLTGSSLTVLEATARGVKGQFELAVPLANDLTAAVSKLATKAGDASRTAEGIRAFLNVGAGQGLNATETLQAVQQAILGIDEGTDKLFQKNPSVIYAEFAESIGTTAGKLSDAQKAMALMNEAIEASLLLGDQYTGFLETAAGKAQQMQTAMEGAKAELGELTLPARLAGLELMTDIFAGLAMQARAAADAISIAAAAAKGGPIAAGVRAAEIDARRAREKQDRERQALRDDEIMTQLAPLQAGRETPQQKAAREKAEREAARKALDARRQAADKRVGSLADIDVLDPFEAVRRFLGGDSAPIRAADRAIGGLGSAMGDLARRDRARTGAFADRFRDAEGAGIDALQADLEQWQGLIGRGVDVFTSSLIQAAGSAEDLSDALGSVLRAIAQAAGSELLNAGLQGVVGFATSGRARRAAEAAGDAAGIAEATSAAAGGPLSLALLGGGLLLSVGAALFGTSEDREEEQYRAHLRALKEARRQETNVTIVLPRGTPNPLDQQWLETISATIDGIAGSGQGRVNLQYRDN